VKPALFAATATKTVQAATVNKSLQFRRRLRDLSATLQSPFKFLLCADHYGNIILVPKG